MTGAVAQILAMYERAALDIETISQELELEPEAVKSVLMQHSSKFRAAIKENLEQDFTKDDLGAVTKAIVDLAHSTEDENLKFRALKYIRDDAKGRKDKVTATKFDSLKVNVLVFNEALRKSKNVTNGGSEKLIEASKVVDI